MHEVARGNGDHFSVVVVGPLLIPLAGQLETAPQYTRITMFICISQMSLLNVEPGDVCWPAHATLECGVEP